MKPREFWELHPDEVWWLIDARRKPQMFGSTSESDMASLADEIEDMKTPGGRYG